MTTSQAAPKDRPVSTAQFVLLGIIASALLWSYLPTLRDLTNTWWTEAEYSHGFLVPAFALALLYFRRELFRPTFFQTSWSGLAFIAVGVACRAAGVLFSFEWFDQISLVPTLAGVVLLFGGWPALKWSWIAIVFLTFMIPLPWKIKVLLSGPLQQIATYITTYTLQTFGFPALREGNIIIINEFRIGVVEACSGLSMLMVFFALSTAVAILIDRPLGDRIIVFLSAIPIAVASNVLRIIVTSLLYLWVDKATGDKFFHDLGGWFMMPLALAFMWLELKLISLVLVEQDEESRPIKSRSGEPSAVRAEGRSGASPTPASVR